MWTKEQKRIWNKQDRKNNPLRYLNYIRNWRKNNPWFVVFHNIKQRINNKNNPEFHRYGGRGIKCLITQDELRELWFRDKAYLLKVPSIDRIDNDGDYTFENCRFIEQAKNKRPQKQIVQLDLTKHIIKIWSTQKEAATELNLHYQNIGRAIRLGWICGGFYWKWRETI